MECLLIISNALKQRELITQSLTIIGGDKTNIIYWVYDITYSKASVGFSGSSYKPTRTEIQRI